MTLEDASPENRSIHLEITLLRGTLGTEWDVPGFSGTLNVIMASASLRPASHERASCGQIRTRGAGAIFRDMPCFLVAFFVCSLLSFLIAPASHDTHSLSEREQERFG